MKSKKWSILKIATLAVVCTFTFGFLLLYAGCRGVNKYVASQRSCRSFNIDNYEVRTRTDIPKTHGNTCNYNEATLTKSSVFQLNVSEEKLSSNISYNKMKRYSTHNTAPFAHNPEWNDSISQLPKEHLYYKKGSNDKDSWVYVLDSVNQTMWAELTAKN